jgi:hypothetical protein
VDAGQPWTHKHLRTLTLLYGKRPYFRTQVLPRLEPLYAAAERERGPGSIQRVLLASMAAFYEPLGLAPHLVLASTLERSHPDKTGRLVSYCQQLGAHTYYSGLGSSLYMKLSLFREADVRVLWQRFRHPPYPQGREGRFVQGLSIVDVLSNVPVDEVREWLKPSPWGPFATPGPTPGG